MSVSYVVGKASKSHNSLSNLAQIFLQMNSFSSWLEAILDTRQSINLRQKYCLFLVRYPCTSKKKQTLNRGKLKIGRIRGVNLFSNLLSYQCEILKDH